MVSFIAYTTRLHARRFIWGGVALVHNPKSATQIANTLSSLKCLDMRALWWQGMARPADCYASNDGEDTEATRLPVGGVDIMSLSIPEVERLDKTAAWLGLDAQVCPSDILIFHSSKKLLPIPLVSFGESLFHQPFQFCFLYLLSCT